MSVLSIDRVDIEERLRDHLDREPTAEEVDEACHWVQKDFDYTHVFETIENILAYQSSQPES